MTDRERPEMLYLDKCWRLLQQLTAQTGPRPAQRLVAGRPNFDSDVGYTPHAAALTPAEIAEVADDLDALAEHGLDAYCATLSERDAGYVRPYLNDALSFTRLLADRGWGLAYLIG